MAAYSENGQWRWRKQILVRGRAVRGSGTPPINTKRAAEAAEAAWMAKAAGGGLLRAGEVPQLGRIVSDYLSHLEMHRSSSLRKNRESTFKVHLLPWFGAMRLDRIGVVEIDRFKKAQLAAELAPGTINNHILTLTNTLRWSVDRGLLADVPKVEMLPRGSLKEVEYLEADQLEAELGKVSGELRTMILVAAHTGLRAGELLALRWADIDLRAGRITVRHNTYRGEDRPPKGKRERTLPLSKTARAALKEQQHLRGPLVFPDANGEPIPYSNALYYLKTATAINGWHVLRHTFGTRLSAAGVPLKAIQEWMGHASIKTTMIYAHYSPTLNSAIGVLDGETWQPGANGLATPTKKLI
jgi:integrase